MFKKIVIILCLSSFFFNSTASKISANIENRSATVALGLGTAVGKYVMQALAVAGLAAYTESAFNPNSNLNQHKPDIQSISDAMWESAPDNIKNDIISSYENSVNVLGQSAISVSVAVQDWFNANFSKHYTPVQSQVLQVNSSVTSLTRDDLRAVQIRTSHGNSGATQGFNFNLMSNSSLIPGFSVYFHDGNSWIESNRMQVNFFPPHSFNTLANGRRNTYRIWFAIAGSTNTFDLGQSHVNSIDWENHVLPHGTGSGNNFMLGADYLTSFAGARVPLVVSRSSNSVLNLLNSMDNVASLESVANASNREIAIPVDDFVPKLDGEVISWNPDAGVWQLPNGVVVNDNQIRDIAWDMPLPSISDGAWDRPASSPDIDIDIDIDTEIDIPAPPPIDLPDDLPDEVPVLSSVIEYLDAILTEMGTVSTKTVTSIKDSADTIVLGLNDALGGVAGVANDIYGAVGTVGATTHGLINDVLGAIYSGTQTLAQSLAGIMDAIIAMSQALGLTLSEVLSAILAMSQSLTLTLSQILSAILTLPLTLATVLVDVLTLVFIPTVTLESIFTDISTAFGNRFPIFSQITEAWNVGYQNINQDDVFGNLYFPMIGNLEVKLFSSDSVVLIVPTFKRWFSVFLYFLTFVFLARKTSRILSEGK